MTYDARHQRVRLCMAETDSLESISSRIQIMSYMQNNTFTCNVIVICDPYDVLSVHMVRALSASRRD